MLSAQDPVTWNPARIAVAGVSGVGKTTLARSMAAALDIPHTELDSLFHGPNWEPLPDFEGSVAKLIAGPRWITEWQYSSARDPIVARADTLVWLDFPSRITMWRVIRRTVLRRVRREELWNGNIEPSLWTIWSDPEHIIRWAWGTRKNYRVLVPESAQRHPGLRVVRLRTPREARRWVAALPRS